MNNPTAAKYLQVRDELARAIREGEFTHGQRLPAERELAKSFGVSHMTARQAITQLVEAELVERRLGSGIYVSLNSRRRLATQVVNIICQEYENSLSSSFLRVCSRMIEARGWEGNIVRLHASHERTAIRLLESGEPAVIFVQEPSLHGRFGEALRKNAGKAVLVGNRLDAEGIPSVLADNADAIESLVRHLKDRGHRDIAIVSDHPGEYIDNSLLEAWRQSLGEDTANLDQRIIAVNTPRFECPGPFTYDAVRSYLEAHGDEISALICLSDELALASLKACRDVGRPVPEKLSLVCTIDSMLMAYSHPPVTSINVNMEDHIELALTLVGKIIEGELGKGDLLRVASTRLVERQSVRQAE